MKEAITDMEKLRGIALDQHGFVTSAQAGAVGVSYPALTYFVKNGRLERVARGIYRVPQVPFTEHDAKNLALLWASPESAVLGYDTALDAYGVCDINPAKIHVVVPPGTRISKAGGKAFVIHRARLDAKDVGWWEGMPTVRLPAAIRQCIDSGVPTYLLAQALEAGASRGMLSTGQHGELAKKLEARR